MITLKIIMVATQDHYSLTLVVCCMKLKLKMYVHDDFSKGKEMFDFTNCSAESKYYDNSKRWQL